MKILVLSDTHLLSGENMNWIESILESNPIDLIVISGDVLELSFFQQEANPYKFLNHKFFGYKVLFCLGNHEFYKRTPEETLNKYRSQYNPAKYDVHCLDVIGGCVLGNVKFLGNVLWYDGSCGFNRDPYDWVGGTWMDKLIRNFDFREENQKCIKQITENLDDRYTQVLVTHCVPHKSLNLHDPSSPYNFYSGKGDLLDMIKVDYSISGHTHLRTIGKVINGCQCINVGNSVYHTSNHYVLDVTEKSDGMAKIDR